jgi:type IV pilus assembly protein PilV
MTQKTIQYMRTQRGVSLIEVLVTILVMSVGLLGLAALQGLSLQAGQAAYYRTQATNLAYEVADFARLNRSAAIASCDMPVLASWQNFVDTQMPGGALAFQFTDCDVGEIEVIVSWNEGRLDAAEGGTESVSVTTRI